MLLVRFIYDRVQNRKNYFEIAAFLNLNEELQEREIQMKTKTQRQTQIHYFEFSLS